MCLCSCGGAWGSGRWGPAVARTPILAAPRLCRCTVRRRNALWGRDTICQIEKSGDKARLAAGDQVTGGRADPENWGCGGSKYKLRKTELVTYATTRQLGWRVHPATLLQLGFTHRHRRHHAPHCHPVRLLLHYSRQLSLAAPAAQLFDPLKQMRK